MKTAFLIAMGIYSCGFAQGQQVLSPGEILKLVPGQIEGFKEADPAKSKLIQIGNLRYSLCERRFSKGKQMIRILLFDYKEAPIMYNQATRDWKNFLPVKSDSTMLQPVTMKLCTGWESYTASNNLSLVYVGISNRYFLNMTGEGVEPETLRKVLDLFHFEQFPL